MSINISTGLLRSLESLTQKRDKLVSELAAVESEIRHVLGDFAPTSCKTAVSKIRRVKSAGKRAKRGSVQPLILQYLKAAGDAGICVKDFSAKLGLKNRSIHT